MARDKVSLDIFWLRDESLEDIANLPPLGVIAREIVEDLEAALAEFARNRGGSGRSVGRAGGLTRNPTPTPQPNEERRERAGIAVHENPWSAGDID